MYQGKKLGAHQSYENVWFLQSFVPPTHGWAKKQYWLSSWPPTFDQFVGVKLHWRARDDIGRPNNGLQYTQKKPKHLVTISIGIGRLKISSASQIIRPGIFFYAASFRTFHIKKKSNYVASVCSLISMLSIYLISHVVQAVFPGSGFASAISVPMSTECLWMRMSPYSKLRKQLGKLRNRRRWGLLYAERARHPGWTIR
jgi:hypothetical protein